MSDRVPVPVPVPAPALLALLLAAGCASGGPAREVVSTPAAPAAIGPYSQAVWAGDTLYLSGQIGIDPATGQLAPGGIEAETRRALDNCRAVLEAAGLALADVAQVQVFLADIGDYAAMNAVYATYFPARPPARAAIGVAALPRGARVEVLMTAVRPAAGRPERTKKYTPLPVADEGCVSIGANLSAGRAGRRADARPRGS